MHEGHYIRNRTKRAYAAKRQALLDYLQTAAGGDQVAAPRPSRTAESAEGNIGSRGARSLSVRLVSGTAFGTVFVAQQR
jgi:hypothetical protein